MADNTTLNTGTGGDVIATDDIGGVKHQRVKVEYGGDGSATDVSTTNPLPASPRCGTPTQSSVNDSASNVTLLSSNSARLGATIFNDSTQILYVKLGTTASTTSYTAQLVPGAYYEVPYGYTGNIDGIWAADASGAARITEFT
jgi:hypothetical protein